jgi:hypothetical protein
LVTPEPVEVVAEADADADAEPDGVVVFEEPSPTTAPIPGSDVSTRIVPHHLVWYLVW